MGGGEGAGEPRRQGAVATGALLVPVEGQQVGVAVGIERAVMRAQGAGLRGAQAVAPFAVQAGEEGPGIRREVQLGDVGRGEQGAVAV